MKKRSKNSSPDEDSSVTTLIQTAPAVHPSQFACLNLEEAIDRMGDRETYLEIARYFASNLERTLDNLADALNEKRTDDATRLAHSLKGNCATVGADAMREKCLVLEQLCRAGELDTALELYNSLIPEFLELRDRINSL